MFFETWGDLRWKDSQCSNVGYNIGKVVTNQFKIPSTQLKDKFNILACHKSMHTVLNAHIHKEFISS